MQPSEVRHGKISTHAGMGRSPHKHSLKSTLFSKLYSVNFTNCFFFFFFFLIMHMYIHLKKNDICKFTESRLTVF